jgi:hypothetical protein
MSVLVAPAEREEEVAPSKPPPPAIHVSLHVLAPAGGRGLTANLAQAASILKYHQHLSRRAPVTLEDAARRWITRYAKLWRDRFVRSRATGAPAAAAAR